MNDELKQRLIKYFDGMEGAIEKATNFTMEQAPLVIQDMINWGIADAVVRTVLLVIVIIALSFVLHYVIKGIRFVYSEDLYNGDRVFFTCLCVGIYCVLISAISPGLYISISQGVKAYVAPRLYVLEQIKDFVNDSK